MLPDGLTALSPYAHPTFGIRNFKLYWTLNSQKIYTLNPLVVYIYIHLHQGNQKKNKKLSSRQIRTNIMGIHVHLPSGRRSMHSAQSRPKYQETKKIEPTPGTPRWGPI